MRKLFPGIVEELQSQGAFSLANKQNRISIQDDVYTYSLPDNSLTCSRVMLEWGIRQRVQKIPGVSFLSGREVIGLETTPDRTRVSGIKHRQRGQLHEQIASMADLVVDASGQSSKLADWLQDLGYKLAEKEEVRSSVGYSTRYYKAVPGSQEEWGGFVRYCVPQQWGIAIEPIENNMWAVILAGMDGMYPAVDAKEFEEQLATSGISPQVLAVLHGAEPLGEPRGYRIPVCIRQHYEQMEQWPAGLLVLGDALCSFDPIYGQGMDAAAVAAETLEECLQEPQTQVRPAFERHVLQRIQEVIQPAWWISTIADLRARGITYCRFRWPVV